MAKKKDKNPSHRTESDTLKAIAESLNQFAGSLTGKNLEERLIEYSEVYGEILLYLYKTLQEHKQEIRHLKKEIAKLEKIHKEKTLPDKNSSQLSPISFWFLVFFSALNLALFIYQIFL